MRPRLVLLALVGSLLAGCGSTPLEPGGGSDPAFTERPLTWVAQAGDRAVLHVGDEERRLPPYVTALRPTAHGYLVSHPLGPGIDAEEVDSLVTADGVQRLPGEPSGPKVSPDGRWLGWIDYAGPRRLGYRLAEAVVVDLSSGREVLRDHRDMGGWRDQDLYGNVWPTFLGFDPEGAAYWETPEAGDDGLVVRRLDLASGEVSGVDADAELVARTRVVDPVRGRTTGMTEAGQPSPTGEGSLGFVTPDGRWCLTAGGLGRLRVTDCASGERVTPRYPARRVVFAGWTDDPDAFWVLATDGEVGLVVPTDEPDPSRGVLARCELPAGTCTTEERVRRLGSLVLPGGPAY